jgi:ComF family protein
MLRATHLITTHLFDLLLPAPCLLCGQANAAYSLLCPVCDHSLPYLSNKPFLCSCCALPLNSNGPLCGKCLQKPPAFQHSSITFSYEHPVDFLIQQFKYRRQLSSGKLLASLLANSSTDTERPDLLVPVPCHWRKRWQRGFNQSELLAHWVGKELRIPVIDACAQTHYHHSQKGLSRRDRLKNQRQSFVVKNAMVPNLADRHIALIDDVVTTTATARTLSELLRKAGAQRVDIWALARTPDH